MNIKPIFAFKRKMEKKDIEDVTQDFIDDEIFNLDNEEDFNKLQEKIQSSNMYFKLEENVTYKVKLTSSNIKPVLKKFEREGEIEEFIKYEISITAKGSDKTEFEGLWEVGVSILNPIMKNYEKDAVFNVSRTGSGKKTRYSVSKDF